MKKEDLIAAGLQLHPDPNARLNDGVWRNIPEWIENAIADGAAIHHQSFANPLLLLARHKNNSRSLRILLKHGADPNRASEEGFLPLHHAAREGNLPYLEKLLKLTSNVDAATIRGNTALHYAAESGELAAVKLLLDKGGNSLETVNDKGQTPRDLAKSEEMKALLLSAEERAMFAREIAASKRQAATAKQRPSARGL